MEAQGIAVLIAGVLAPLLVQLVRKLAGPVTSNDLVAQAVSLLISILLAAAALALTGELAADGTLLGAFTAVFTISTVIYKQFQGTFDQVLDFKNGA